jgi:hypothetical protein
MAERIIRSVIKKFDLVERAEEALRPALGALESPADSAAETGEAAEADEHPRAALEGEASGKEPLGAPDDPSNSLGAFNLGAAWSSTSRPFRIAAFGLALTGPVGDQLGPLAAVGWLAALGAFVAIRPRATPHQRPLPRGAHLFISA